MRKLYALLVIVMFAGASLGQQAGSSKVKVAGCVQAVNGKFELITQKGNYVLKGDHDALFGYTGKLVEVTGKVDAAAKSQPPELPVVLHVSKLKKLADACQ